MRWLALSLHISWGGYNFLLQVNQHDLCCNELVLFCWLLGTPKCQDRCGVRIAWRSHPRDGQLEARLWRKGAMLGWALRGPVHKIA